MQTFKNVWVDKASAQDLFQPMSKIKTKLPHKVVKDAKRRTKSSDAFIQLTEGYIRNWLTGSLFAQELLFAITGMQWFHEKEKESQWRDWRLPYDHHVLGMRIMRWVKTVKWWQRMASWLVASDICWRKLPARVQTYYAECDFDPSISNAQGPFEFRWLSKRPWRNSLMLRTSHIVSLKVLLLFWKEYSIISIHL